MRIDKIHIQNFRCFKDYKIEFAEKTTVLIGKNGTGKTNLLVAIVSSLSFPFAKNVIKGMQTISTSSPDLKIAEIDTKGAFDARFDGEMEDYIYPIKLSNIALFDNKPLQWELVKEKKGGGLSSKLYQEAYVKFQEYYNENSNDKPLPVLAFFTDSFPHIEAYNSHYAKSLLISDNNFPRNFGYYKWDEKNNCTAIWMEKYKKSVAALDNYKLDYIGINPELFSNTDKQRELTYELEEILRNIKNDPNFIEINFIDDRIKKFTEPLRDDLNFINEEFQVDKIRVGTAKRLQLTFKDGRKMFFDSLPQGYKRLFSIVLDIAYRSYILNKNVEPSGIVFIDEVELHLHPTLQQEVLETFRMTFPNIQYIVSTHSPLVISNIKADGRENKIIKLVNDGDDYRNETVENVYGIDYVSNLMEIMGSAYRSSTIDKMINAYLVLFGRNKHNEAELMLQRLRDYLGGSIPNLLQKEIEKKQKAYL